MSSTPRSVLRKRPGHHDDRRVSFAEPLSYEKQAPRKQLPIAKTTPVAKKSKPADESLDIISLGNQQSDITESIIDVESKFMKQAKTVQDWTNELLGFTQSVSEMDSGATRVQAMLAEHAAKLGAMEQRGKRLVEQAGEICKQFEARQSAESKYSEVLVELQKAISFVNCTKIYDVEGSEPLNVDYDRLLVLVDKLEALSDELQ
ncbi:unnamed protein product [Caenorhabditis sp. 36 PRJEB53466]|nr:unnamed protein product [Caenorhabditis sp. 36 PRJEB53466]